MGRLSLWMVELHNCTLMELSQVAMTKLKCLDIDHSA